MANAVSSTNNLIFDKHKAKTVSGMEVRAYTPPKFQGANQGVSTSGSPIVPGLTCAVSPSVIPFGSLVLFDNTIWYANDSLRTDDTNTKRIELCFYSVSKAVEFDKAVNQRIYYIPPGSDGNYKELYDFFVKGNDLLGFESHTESTDEQGSDAVYSGGSKVWNNFPQADSYSTIYEQLKRSNKIIQQKYEVKHVSIGDSSSGNMSLETTYGASSSTYIRAISGSNADLSHVPLATAGQGGEVPGIGGGVAGAVLGKNGVVDFMRFIQTIAFKEMMQQMFSYNGSWSVHDYINTVMNKFYHQLYYVPNLAKNKVILVKPETLFAQPPSCNIIYPNMKNNITFARNMKMEPTRLVQVTNPIQKLSGTQGTSNAQSLYTIVWTEEQPIGRSINNFPMYYTNAIGVDSTEFQSATSSADKAALAACRPVMYLSNFEKRNGIRTATVNKGADMYLYMVTKKTKDEVQRSRTGTNTIKGKVVMSLDASGEETVANVLGAIAKYELCRARYTTRNGSVEMYFNPYIVPGFPMTSLETTQSGMTIHGYVTNVVHSLTERSWTTTVAFNCARTDDEAVPAVFPITEVEYADKIADTYKDMLGDTVEPISPPAIQREQEEYVKNSQDDYITRSYRKVWRRTPTLTDYCAGVADGALINENSGYLVLQNKSDPDKEGTETGFFDTTIQKGFMEYTQRILDGEAFHISEVN